MFHPDLLRSVASQRQRELVDEATRRRDRRQAGRRAHNERGKSAGR
jgi:hypothetical protein